MTFIEYRTSGSPERRPLLHTQVTDNANKTDYTGKPRWRIWPTFTTTATRYRYVPFLGCLIVFINEAEWFFKQVASLRAIEAMYCVEFYATRDPEIAALGKHIPENLCKDNVIQKQLAKTAGLVMFFRMFAAILGAVPLGQIADKMGRKIVLVLHKLNVVVSSSMWLLIYLLYPMLPTWTLYFTGAAGLIGGNFDLGLAILFASYTDVMPSARERATLFFLTTSMQYVAQAFCPPIGGWLMNLDGKGGTPEVAMMVSLVTALLAAFVTIFFFPETLEKSMRARPPQHDQECSAQEDQVQASNGLSQRSRVGEAIISRLKKEWQDIKLGVSGVGFGNISLLAVSILCAAVGIKATDWYGLIQYPVIKLGWTFPQVRKLPQVPIPKTDPLKASLVVSFQALVLLLNFGLLLPTYNRLGSMYFGSAAYASFAIMIGSSIVLSGGVVLVGLSNTSAAFLLGMVIYTLGEGITVATQAYIASVIEKSYLARVMTVLSIAATGGKAIASGLFPRVLALGLDTHIKELIGLPFFVAAGLFLIAGGCVVIVRFRMRRSSEIDGSSPSLEREDRIEE